MGLQAEASRMAIPVSEIDRSKAKVMAMINEANSSMSHEDMKKMLKRTLEKRADLLKTEWKLPNERIADIYFVEKGFAHIIEVKTELKDSLMVEAFSKYGKECDYLYVATGWQIFIPELTKMEKICWGRTIDKIGLILVQWDSIVVLRPAVLLE